MMASETVRLEYPLLGEARAQLSDDGQALLIDGTAFDDTVVRFAVGLSDVRNLVAFLVTTLAKLDRQNPAVAALMQRHAMPAEPVSISSFSVSEGAGADDALMVVGVGPIELVFSLPSTAFDPIGRALLTASAKPRPSGPA